MNACVCAAPCCCLQSGWWLLVPTLDAITKDCGPGDGAARNGGTNETAPLLVWIYQQPPTA